MISSNPIDLALRIATAIVTERRLRRRVMVHAILIAAAQCFAGTVLLPPSISETPWFLLLFWGSCLFLVFLAIGLAVLDLLKLRQQLAAELRHLRKDLGSELPGDGGERRQPGSNHGDPDP